MLLALHIRWPEYWSFGFSISPSSEYSGLISLQSKGLSRVFSRTIQKSIISSLALIFLVHLSHQHDYWKNHRFDCVCEYIYVNECSGFIAQAPSWALLPPPSSSHLSGSSQFTGPEHPVSCIEPGLVIYFTYDIRVSMLFSQIIPPSPSPTESKSLFFRSVSLLLSCI